MEGAIKKLLVVDDETAFLLAAKRLLGLSGIEVDTAESLEKAMRLLEENNYDAVIADIRLGGTNGEEGLEIARFAKGRCPKTPVILVTGYGSQEIKDRANKLGVEFYFEKPVSIELLRVVLKGLEISNGAGNGS